MSTTAIAKGRATKLAIGFQGAFATPAAEDSYKATYFYAQSLRERSPLEDDPLLGGDQHNGRDAREPLAGLSEHGGDIEVPLDLNHLGYWLKLAFGDPATSGAGDKTHVFSSGAAALPVATIEVKNLAADYRQHVAVAARSFGLEIAGDQAGTQRVRIGAVGRQEVLLGASAAGVIPAAEAVLPVPRTLGVVKFNGAAIGSLRSCRWDYTTGLVLERYVDGIELPGAAVLDEDATSKGEFRVRHTGTSFEAAAIAGTVGALAIEFAKTATRSLSIALGQVKLERSGVPINGPGGLEATYAFTGFQDADSAMAVATLKNAIAAY
jgi:Phage tail tube protein